MPGPSLAPGTSGSLVPRPHPAKSSANLAGGGVRCGGIIRPHINDSWGWPPATPGCSPSRPGASPSSCGQAARHIPVSSAEAPGLYWACVRTQERPFSLPSGRGRPASPPGPHVEGGSIWLAEPGGPPLVGVLIRKGARGNGLGGAGLWPGHPWGGSPASPPSASPVLPAQVPPRGSDTRLGGWGGGRGWQRAREESLRGWAPGKRGSRSPWGPQCVRVLSR